MQITCVTFDCDDDPTALVAFWCEALGYEARGHCCYPPDRVGPYLEFSPAPEDKVVKNRVHLGTSTDDVDVEVARLCALGATVAWEEEFPPDWKYRNLVLRDPAGNEFCLGGPK